MHHSFISDFGATHSRSRSFLRKARLTCVAALAGLLSTAALEASTISFSAPSYRVNEGDGNAFITVTLDRAGDPDPGATVTVEYKTIPGSATGGAAGDPNRDYTTQDTASDQVSPGNPDPLTFGPGENTKVIAVPINNDSAVENNENFSVILFGPQASGPSAYSAPTLATSTTTVTIFDNDSTSGTIGFTSATYTINENPQNNGGSGSVVLTVTRSGDTTRQVNVNYTTVSETATENADYQGQSGTIVFNPGETSKQIVIPVFNDGQSEGDETFSVDLSPDFGGINTATVTIVDDDTSTVNFSSTGYSVSETAGSATITLLRTGNTSSGASVNVITVSQTARGDQDYVTTARSVDFGPGQTAATFDVPILNDNQVEGTETFRISLSARANSGVVIGANSSTTVSIIDDEGANTIEFLGTDFSVNENEPSQVALITVRLNRGGNPNDTVTVQYFTSTGSATAGQDYQSASGTLTFGPNESFRTFSVPIINDASAENTETFGVVLANPSGNAFLGANSTATVSILDDDSAGTIQFSNATYGVFESSGFVTLTVLLNRTGNTNAPVSVDFRTVAGSAASNQFVPVSGTLNFAAGSSVATISVAIQNDSVIEAPQSFSVALSNPRNASLGNPSAATVTIQDDDGLNTVEFDAADYGAVETSGAVQVRVRAVRGGDPNQVLTVRLALGGAGDTATNPEDYQTPSQTTITFPAGVSVQSVTIPITNNFEAQGLKRFTVSLTDPGPFTSIGRQSTARVTIFDDSGPNTVQLLTSVNRFREGDQAAIAITVVRFGEFHRNGTNVSFTTELRPGDSAREGVNFTATSGTIEFAPLVGNLNGQNVIVGNETQKSIIIPIPNNTLIEGDVTFHVTLTGSDVAQLGSITTTQVTITDDDLGNVIQLSNPTYSVVESNGNAVLTVNLIPNGDASRASSIDFAATPITAFGGFDFSPVTGTLTFAPGETSKSILIPVNNDSISEGSETFRVTLSNPGPGSVVGSPSNAIVTIIDDDVSSAIQFSPSSYTVSETGGSVTLTLTAARRGNPSDTLSVRYQTAGGTAAENQDYAGTSGIVTFGPGETQRTITVQILNDNLIESTENFSVILSNPSQGASIGVASSATIDISDDDNPNASIGFSAASFDVDEGAGFANLTVRRSGGLGVSATVDYVTTDGTALAGRHYVETRGSITFNPGEVSRVIQVPIIDDSEANPTLSFTVTLSSQGGTGFVGGQSTANVNIIDNDATTFRFNPASYTVDEGAGTVTLTVEALRIGDPNEEISVDYVTSDGSARAGEKYQRTFGRLVFGANVTTRTISVPIFDETSQEGTTSFFVNLSNPQGGGDGAGAARVGTPGTATVTIIDNDATTFQFSSSSYTARNSSGAATVSVTLSRVNDPNGTFSVDFFTSDMSAVAGRDYEGTSGRLTFEAGQTVQFISIPLTPQAAGQPTRQFRVELANPSGGAVIGQLSSAIVNIINPDESTKPVNISTRGRVESGDAVMIAGFIIQGDQPKRVIIRGLGPSLTSRGVVNALQDTSLDLRDGAGNQIEFNDNWRDNRQQEIIDTKIAPTDDRESAIVTVLSPGSYTTILRGTTNGFGLIEVYDLESTSSTHLVNISTRAKVERDNNGALIGGFIIEGSEGQRVLIRAIGPTLKALEVEDALEDPTLELYRGSQKILSNDNWKTQTGDGIGSRQEIEASGVAPRNDRESAILVALDPGSYTAVIRGKNNTTGVALVEVYQMP